MKQDESTIILISSFLRLVFLGNRAGMWHAKAQQYEALVYGRVLDQHCEGIAAASPPASVVY